MATDRRHLEFELNGRAIAVAGGLVVIGIVALWYLVLRPSHHEAGANAAAGQRAAAVEDIGRTETVFDRAGNGGATPDASRQVTPEPTEAGGFEVDLGSAPDRPAAERVRDLARSFGYRAAVALDRAGAYRVVAGPFPDEAQARRAGGKLQAALGRPVPVKPVR